MNITKQLQLVVLICILPFSVTARDFSHMYQASELRRANGVYSRNIQAVLFEDIAGYLRDDELTTLRRVSLLQPWDRTVDPFEFSADPETGVILVPTFSVKFFDDIAIATSWFERFKCNKESVFDYAAALDFSSIDLPDPLTALDVPQEAYKLDGYVDDVSQKILKSAIAFILLHELGHVHHGHQHYDQITAAQAQDQEAEADRFAMRVLRRMRLPPMGMTVWFMAVSMRDPLVPGSPRQRHPLTSSRLQAIATELRTRPGDFIEPANQRRITTASILSIADDIDGIGRLLADPDLRSFLRERGRIVTPALLGGACQAQQHDQEWMRRFRHLFE
jgi:hypothetical protein